MRRAHSLGPALITKQRHDAIDANRGDDRLAWRTSAAADALGHPAGPAARRALTAPGAASPRAIGAIILSGRRLLGRYLVTRRHVLTIGTLHLCVVPTGTSRLTPLPQSSPCAEPRQPRLVAGACRCRHESTALGERRRAAAAAGTARRRGKRSLRPEWSLRSVR